MARNRRLEDANVTENNNLEEANVTENALNENQDAPMPATSKFVELIINSAFTDKNTGAHYKIGDVVSFDEVRATELLADSRNLVSKK